MDYEAARANMIEQQIRPWNVLAAQTLNALAQIRREDFVPPRYRDLAFADVQIPLADGAVMLEPKLSARMMEALDLGPDDEVLDVGTGSGYLAALMASVCAHVTSVEINEELHTRAARNLAIAGVENVTLEQGDAHDGWGDQGRFDAILLSGSLPIISDKWAGYLKDGGRLVGIEGQLPAMAVVRLSKKSGKVKRESLFETVVPRLQNVNEAKEFVF